MKERVVLALDLGGTNVRVVAVTESGEILARRHSQTGKGSASEIYDLIAELAERCGADAGIKEFDAFGAAIPTTDLDESGVLGSLPNISQLEGTNISREIGRRTGLPVRAVNDASAATLGEFWLGASKGTQNAVGITLGTGVGGGLIVDGRLYTGTRGGAGEIGHIRLVPGGIKCGCGGSGCLEQYCSATAILRRGKQAGLAAESAREVFDLAQAQNEAAGAIFSEMGSYLGLGLSIVNNLLSPDIIVIGGGVAAGWAQFFEPTRESLYENSLPDRRSRVKIMRALLGDDAGVLGAAKYTFQHLN
ncbi:MAG: ROK family protein [Acidobacteria bacterium]|nr:ROK family protein [Acidobacteriota bacterium]